MKVYLVWTGFIFDSNLKAIYSTEKLAKKFVKFLLKEAKDKGEIYINSPESPNFWDYQDEKYIMLTEWEVDKSASD